jgi:cell division protein FtsB
MRLIENFKKKKLILLNIFLTLYVSINFIGGERGLISYFEKNSYEKMLSTKNSKLKNKLEKIEHKNKLLSTNLDFDYLETLYRTKLKFGKKNEILIKLKQ